jgi:Ca2+-binding EF-hand superfamily protein
MLQQKEQFKSSCLVCWSVHADPCMCHCGAQVYDGLLLEGQLVEYEEAFNAVDKSGNGSIGERGKITDSNIGQKESSRRTALSTRPPSRLVHKHPNFAIACIAGAMELKELFAKMGNPLSFEKLSDIMLQYDRDESGQIEFPEFLLMFRDHLVDLQVRAQRWELKYGQTVTERSPFHSSSLLLTHHSLYHSHTLSSLPATGHQVLHGRDADGQPSDHERPRHQRGRAQPHLQRAGV